MASLERNEHSAVLARGHEMIDFMREHKLKYAAGQAQVARLMN